MAITRRQFLRRSAIAVAGAGLDATGALGTIVLRSPARKVLILGAGMAGLVEKCWTEDEWARGAWAFVGFGDFFTASSREGRIHFAGEHLSPWVSWMQGALSSGLRVVKEIEESAKTV